ncbi:unnamed protein product [Staurois parvus]|uniref:Uncharacterized protein n=1 Tax=Staurois parvus TaxID=386267 RepID=A0ABN9A718_9NEOB|nr:unnamed protein product [Staurois parvus]
MRRCSGGPCSTYLVLRSHDVSSAASPAISSGRCRGIRLLCSGPRDVGTYGRRRAAGNLKNLKNVIFFFFQF